MEGERMVLPPMYDDLSISFSAPNEMGFLQFEGHHNQISSFLDAAAPAASQPLEGGAATSTTTPIKPTTTTTNNNGYLLGLSNNEFLNNDQLIALEPKAVNDDGDNNEDSHSWWRNNSWGEKNKVKIRRKLREPRFCFQTRSDVDVLDDGYKWRKYGQKVVKNSLHPRSYYRCTHSNCRVKKRVERLSEDCRMVITTYEGRHNHSPSGDDDSQQQDSFISF